MAIGHIAGKKDNKMLKCKGNYVHDLASSAVQLFLLLATYLLLVLL